MRINSLLPFAAIVLAARINGSQEVPFIPT
jgi:hypothetical protein